MIGAVMHLSWISLRRDKTALVLTFVLPIVFFSIFASVFGDLDSDSQKRVDTAVVNQSSGALSEGLVERIGKRPELNVILHTGADTLEGRHEALELVRNGAAAVAIVIPADFDARLDGGESAQVELLADVSDPIAVSAVSGLLSAAALDVGYALGGAGQESKGETEGLLDISVVDVLGRDGKRASIAYFAAGLGVLFLLFSMSNRCALFIDEQASGVLDRLLSCELGATRLLFGRWLFLSALGVIQVTLMFVWAALVFGLPLWSARHLSGFAAITVATAAAAAAFGIVLALICKTREQLVATSMVVVLVMAAVGGNLFPRFLMPEHLQTVGLMTFNAWALDGYQKVFWYDAPVNALAPELLVLGGTALLFFAAARLLARRWELLQFFQ